MKKPTKFLVVTLLLTTIFGMSFIPVGLAWGGKKHKVTFRPITDWTDVNPWGIGPEWYQGYANDQYWMWIDSLMDHFWLFNWDTFEPLTEYFYEFDGHVKEKLLRDGTLEITVKLYVKDLYMEVMDTKHDENGDPIWTMEYFGDNGQFVASGYVDYFFEFKFTLAPEYDGFTGTIVPTPIWPIDFDIPEGTRTQGCELPNLWAFLFFPDELGIQIKSLKLIAFGSGVVYEPGWFYPEPPETEYPPGPFEAGTTDIFFYFNTKFKSNDDYAWVFGSTFKSAYIILYNTEYY